MTAQEAVTRSERLALQPYDRQAWLLNALTEVLIDDLRFCGLVDGVLNHWAEEDAKAAAQVEREMAEPPCPVCAGHVGHSLVCPHYAASLVTA